MNTNTEKRKRSKGINGIEKGQSLLDDTKLKILSKIIYAQKDDTLGLVYVKLPEKDEWKKFYVRY